jgi:hypothetical protein
MLMTFFKFRRARRVMLPSLASGMARAAARQEIGVTRKDRRRTPPEIHAPSGLTADLRIGSVQAGFPSSAPSIPPRPKVR